MGNCCRELPAACLSDLRASTTEPRPSYKGRRSRTSPNHRYRCVRQQHQIQDPHGIGSRIMVIDIDVVPCLVLLLALPAKTVPSTQLPLSASVVHFNAIPLAGKPARLDVFVVSTIPHSMSLLAIFAPMHGYSKVFHRVRSLIIRANIIGSASLCLQDRGPLHY